MSKRVVDLNKILKKDSLEGEFENIRNWLNKKITITEFRILKSELFNNEFIIIQAYDKDKNPFLLSVSSVVLLEQFKKIEKEYGNKDIIIKCKIKKIDTEKGKSYYTLEA